MNNGSMTIAERERGREMSIGMATVTNARGKEIVQGKTDFFPDLIDAKWGRQILLRGNAQSWAHMYNQA